MRHLLAAYDLSTDKLYGHVKSKKGRSDFLSFMRYVRTLAPRPTSASPSSLTTSSRTSRPRTTLGSDDWAEANNVELAYTPHYASWLNRIEAQFTALRYFCLDGTDHESHEAQAFLIRRYIAWRNRNAQNETLRELVKRANVA